MSAFDLSQDRFRILDDRFRAFAGILNFDGIQRYRLGEIGLAR